MLEFQAWNQSGVWPWLLCGAAGTAALLIALLYRDEQRLVSRPVGLALLGLRVLAVATLFFVLLQPAFTWRLDEQRQGRIVVAIDDSESMTTSDAHATKGERLRWARGLGMIGNAATDARLNHWQADLDADREPEWIEPREASDPEQGARLARSRQESLEAILTDVGKLPRKEIVRRLLQQTAHPLLEGLDHLGRVQLLVFGGKAEATDPQSLEKTLDDPPASLIAQKTDLSQPLTLAGTSEDASPLRGVILLTDGRDTSGRNALGLAARFGQVQAPIYPILIGSKRKPRDISIASVDAPETVYKDDHPVIKVVVSAYGYDGQDLLVTLEREGGETVEKSGRVENSTLTLEFPIDASKVGRQQFTVRTDVKKGESRDDNNTSTFGLSVVDDKLHVLLVEGEARWEFRFLDNAFRRDDRVDVHEVLYQQPSLGLNPEPFFPRQLNLPKDPADLEHSPFAERDLVVIGDIPSLPAEAWDLLDKFVAEGGGTLVLTAGKRRFPLAHRSPVLERLLPITDPQPLVVGGINAATPPRERGFRLQLTLEGEQQSMLQFDADTDDNRRIWSNLPGHLWALIGTAKPGATVYAYARFIDKPDDTLEAERGRPIIVHQNYGLGQVLWIGIDSTWRWRYRAGDTYHHRFWGQLGRWAANNKAGAGSELVKLGLERSEISAGDDALIRVRWTQAFAQRFPKAKFSAELLPKDAPADAKPLSVVPLAAAPERPLTVEGRALSLPAGAYRVHLTAAEADLGPTPITAELYVNEPRSVELNDVSSNPALLEKLALASGGRMLTIDQASEVLSLIEDPQHTVSQQFEIRIWDHWLMFAVLCAVLTGEWVLRKLNGLP